ncbi:MAG: sulfotransferase [Aestuariivirga sp.]|nr:sulfotransferase [Aestuariivirga sp.]
MNQLKSKTHSPANAAASLAKEISLEFVRISKLSESGKDDEAWQAANALYAKHPNDGTANFIIALILAGNQQKSDALSYAEAAVKFAPDNAIYKVFLGKLYVELGMIEFAPDILHKAFAMDKTLYQAPLELAKYYYESGQGARALPYYDLALKSAPPASVSTIRLYRADCLRSLGRVSEAEADYNLAVGAPQHRVTGLIAIALLQKNDHTSDYAGQVRRELELPGLNNKERSVLLLCLGRMHENGRDYDNAFLNFDRSRKLSTSKFNLGNFVLQVDEASRVFTRDVFEKFRQFGHESEKPIFVIGMPRSGTTMTEQIIAAHSQAEGVGELARMGRLSSNFANRNGGMRQVLNKVTEVGPELWKDVPRQYLNLVNALAPDARRTVDKMPHNFLNLGFIHLCFPNARIIHCKRNPLDNFISAFQNPMNAFHSYSYDQVAYGKYYVDYLRLMDHWKAAMPGMIYESQYEELTANPEVEVRNILNFLGLPWEDACLKFNEREVTVKTFSRLQVRNPINTGSVARWRNYEKHLQPIMAVLEQAGVEF